MKITIVQGAFLPVPPLMGGAVEKMWYELAKEFVRQGHEVDYISKSYEGLLNLEYDNGINHVRVKGYQTPSSGIILKFLDLLYTLRAKNKISKKTDIIVSNTFWLPIFLPKKQKHKCLIDVARMPKGQMKFYTENGRLRANSTPVSNAIKEEIKAKYYDKVIVIPNTLPFKSTMEIDFNKKEKIILYTGRIHPEKGLDILIQSFALVQSKEWQLQIVGPYATASGGGGVSYLNELKALAKEANVTFLEPIYDMDKLNEIYYKASVFVYPSIAEKGETFGVSPLEAMSWGCATIVSDLECFKDFLFHNENGLCFNHRSVEKIELLHNHLENLIADPNLIHSLASAGLKVNQTHSNEKLSIDFLKEFELMKTI